MSGNGPEEYFSSTVSRDLLSMVSGDKIGSGAHRHVYRYKQDESLVIKFELNAQSFSNIMEWENWKRWKEAAKVCAWLTPCVDISPCGTILLQKRTTIPEKWPDTVPGFLTDRKKENYGMLDGRLVCHDYAFMIVNISHKMIRANWW